MAVACGGQGERGVVRVGSVYRIGRKNREAENWGQERLVAWEGGGGRQTNNRQPGGIRQPGIGWLNGGEAGALAGKGLWHRSAAGLDGLVVGRQEGARKEGCQGNAGTPRKEGRARARAGGCRGGQWIFSSVDHKTNNR